MKRSRQKIREAVAANLAGIATVYTSRIYPKLTLPVISVYGNNEQSEGEATEAVGPQRYSRRLTLEIEITAEATEGADDAVDDLSAQVEAAMAADRWLGGLAEETGLAATRMSFANAGDTQVATAPLSYLVWYRTHASDPENPIT